MLACVSASGVAMPPLVIFTRKSLAPQLVTREVPQTRYALSPSGWIDGEILVP